MRNSMSRRAHELSSMSFICYAQQTLWGKPKKKSAIKDAHDKDLKHQYPPLVKAMSLIRVLATPLPCRFSLLKKMQKKKKKRRWREKWHTSLNPWADWSVFEPRMGSRAKGILTSLSTGTGELDTLLTSQNHSMMDLPSYVVHHLSADNFQSVLRELSFIKQFMQPMNSFLVLFNFKLKKRSERSNFKP